MPIDFQPYLAAILTSDDYQDWQDYYTPTTAEDRRLVATPQPGQSPVGRFPSRLTLRVKVEKAEKYERLEQWDVLAGLRHYAADHVALIGKPGSGKSTSLEQLLWEEAERAQQDPNARIPVLVKLRRCTDSLEALIRDFLQQHRVVLDIAQVEDCLRQGRFLLLLDGLNELPEAFRPAAVNFRDRYRATTPMIVSTRDLVVGGVLGIQKTLKMLPLTASQMREFVRGYLGAEGDRLFQQLQGDRLRKFAETPLLLWMLCRVFAESRQVPSNLGLVFREFAHLHDQDLQANVPTDSWDQWPKLLRHLAFEMMQGQTPTELRLSISQEAAEDCLTTYLQEAGWADPRGCAVRWLQDLVKYHLIQPVIQPNFEQHLEFRHQLIQEYYAAEYLLRCLPQLSDEVLKRDYLNYLKWTEPVALMLALLDEEEQALRVVWLAMEGVDLMLGSRLAGAVKSELQAITVGWINHKKLPIELKIRCYKASRSLATVPSLFQILQSRRAHQLAIDVLQLAIDASIDMINEETAIELLNIVDKLDHFISCDSVRALVDLESETVIHWLLQVVDNPDSCFFFPVVEVLISVNNQDSIVKLFQLLEKIDQDDSDQVNVLNAIMADQRRGIRHEKLEYIADRLVMFGDESVISHLLELLEHLTPEIYNIISKSFIRQSHRKAVREAMTNWALPRLEHPQQELQQRAVQILKKIGHELMHDQLIQDLESDEFSVRACALYGICPSDNQAIILALINILGDTRRCIDRSAAGALYKFDPNITNPLLLKTLDNSENKILDDSANRIRRGVISILGNNRYEAAIPKLVSLLEDEDLWTRIYAITALCNLKCKAAIPRLIQCLEDVDERVCRSAVFALARLGYEPAIPILIQSLEKPQSFEYIGRETIQVLEDLRSEAAIAALLNFLDHHDRNIRSHAALSLGRLNVESAIPKLIEMLQDECVSIRNSAMDALVLLNRPEFYPIFIQALDDSSRSVFQAAAKALGKLGRPDALAKLWQRQLAVNEVDKSVMYTAISQIQSRCQFYNYDIWQLALINSLPD